MKLTLKIAKVLVKLKNGESVSSSLAKSNLIDELISENIIWQKGKHRKTLFLRDDEALADYLINQLQINNLEKYVLILEDGDSSRAEAVKITSDSKISNERAFKGFLLNSYTLIEAKLNGKDFTINPLDGSFIFIYDFENFTIDKDVVIVGVENAKNFRHIQEQAYLFENMTPLFVSRYPQNQNKDFIKWLKSISNKYLHFGDFDISGIGIYLNEYKKYIGEKAKFFIPEDITETIKKGNRDRYDNQKINFNVSDIEEGQILKLIEIINKEKKGLDQEFYILDKD